MDDLFVIGFPVWAWVVLGLALLAAEVLLPGIFLMWLGLAAIGTGLVVYAFSGLGFAGQAIVFALLAVCAVGVWFRLRPGMREQQEEPALNRRGLSYVGRVLTLEQAIVNGVGQARIEDSVWRVTGTDLPAGAAVRVTAVEGATLRVVPAAHG